MNYPNLCESNYNLFFTVDTLQVKSPILFYNKPIDVMKHRPTYNVLSVTLCKQSSVSFNKYLLSQF